MQFKLTLIFLSFIVLAQSQLFHTEWEMFKLKHAKQYSNDREEIFRYGVFLDNMKLIEQYQAEDPGVEFGITQFTDLTPSEFERLYLGLDPSLKQESIPLNELQMRTSVEDIPTSWDWREHGAVSSVKDQGLCGSCWAFSAIGNMEGQYFLKYNNLTNLSVQELVDCDTLDKGCDGGYMQNAFTWLSQSNGSEPWVDYPYFGFQMQCKIIPADQIVKVKGYQNISTNETEIAQALYNIGPLATGMNANPLQFYVKGIFSPIWCKDQLNHGVLFIGYGTGKKLDKEVDYWIVKNSWGATWGEQGTFRIERGKGKCAINTDVSTVVLA
jgi:cathepsin F